MHAALAVLAALQIAAVGVPTDDGAQAAAAVASPESLTERISVSLDRIRHALETQNQPLEWELTQPTQPTFRTEIRGWRVESLFDRLDFNGGPVPPGGLYAFEQAQRLGNPWAGVPIVKVSVLPLIQAARHAISDVRHDRADRAAREEAQRAVIRLCGTRADCP
jgi:hypothetical protein